jgi:hypothetical protein
VLFLKGADGEPVLPGYVSAACCAARLPEADGSVHRGALQLLGIAEKTGVGVLVPYSASSWARVPVPLLYQVLRQRGLKAEGAQLRLTWSTLPLAVAIRDALARRVQEFPAVRTVWVSQARWLETGEESLMLHIAVDEELPSASAQRLMETLFSEEVVFSTGDPKVGMLALNTTTHATSIADLKTMALDTVWFDHATGKVHVVSREFDEPKAE